MNLPRASQTIPPRIRRYVSERDGRRCIVPGCSCAAYLQVHHLELRSEGGTHDPDKMVLLCSAHHAAAHGGTLIIEGCVSRGLAFSHADGTRYGDASVSPALSDAFAEAFEALRALGFREKDSRRVLDELRTHVGSEDGAELILRRALRALRAGRA